MDFMNTEAVSRLEQYFGRIGEELGNDERRASFATYAMGILSDAERKSAEPLAARACADPAQADAGHQRLLHFLANSRWSDHAVRRVATRHAVAAMTAREPVEAWILDDTGFLKQGSHTVGVQRQYTGSAGKVTNCQIGVSLAVATRTDQVPIDFELYLPDCWANDSARRREARIPDEVRFATKPELGLQMVRRALADEVPKGLVLADAGYGASSEFRRELRDLELEYAVAVNPTTKVRLLGKDEKPRGKRQSVKELAKKLDKDHAFHRCTWRQGTRRDLTARFARRRIEVSENETATLLIEWRDDECEPANYFFISISKVESTKKLVRLVMQRWRIERTYEDLKGELGLDHYEGRRFPGWHHHVTVVLACYAFVVAERARHFPPSARRTTGATENSIAPREALPGQLHHCPACHLADHRHLASPLSPMPPSSITGLTQ
jgi:SRSO17 transposase